MDKIILEPVGFVSSPVSERMDENWGEVKSKILLRPEFAGALLGLEDFSHALIVSYLHEANNDKEKHLQRRPRNLKTMPMLGIFSQRAKNRPNPIGITAVQILKVGEDYIEIKGLDAIDNALSMLELYEVKVSRVVLRRPGGGNIPRLSPDRAMKRRPAGYQKVMK
ncbi:MAG: SAM-dependent methyltransferase [Deltaproteobacteria bacterium]|nr:SAM-dependent methyltransferase [Deltaproteobacteria bacterium]